MKKILCFLMVFLIISSYNCFAAGNTLSVSCSGASIGEETDVYIDFSGDGTLCAFNFAIRYDSAAMELTGVQRCAMAEGVNLVTNAEDPLVQKPEYITVTGSSLDGISGSGHLLKMSFKINEMATPTIPISFSYSDDDFIGENYENVAVMVNESQLSVSGTFPFACRIVDNSTAGDDDEFRQLTLLYNNNTGAAVSARAIEKFVNGFGETEDLCVQSISIDKGRTLVKLKKIYCADSGRISVYTTVATSSVPLTKPIKISK